MSNAASKPDAFSLVELSIVLVVLGLLVGGVLSGQSLIRASELRSITSEYNNFFQATNAFKDKYFYLPGDMPNATQFWGLQNVSCRNSSSTTQATCDGNGDGILTITTTNSREVFRFWQHLANAGLINGSNFSGVGTAPCSTCTDAVKNTQYGAKVGVNSPASKIYNATWATINLAEFDPSVNAGQFSDSFTPNGTNYFGFGETAPGVSLTRDPALKAEEAWNIDTKMDDGLPGKGNVVSWKRAEHPNCVTTNNPNTSVYRLNNTNSKACALWFTMN